MELFGCLSCRSSHPQAFPVGVHLQLTAPFLLLPAFLEKGSLCCHLVATWR